MGSADGSAAQWVDETCQALSTAELFVHPDMGDSRFAEATTVLQTVIGWSFESSWPDDSQVQDEVRPYFQKVLGLVMPSLVVAALLLLCLLPLWVARCCAHRCCAPSRPSYSSKHKGQACGCCSLWGLATLVCVVVGLLSSAQAAEGVHAQTCTLYKSLGVAAEQAKALNASVGALVAAGGAYNRDAVAPSVDALARLVGAFDEPGVAYLACAEMEMASEIASNLGGKVTAANQTFAGQDIPAWTEMVQSLNQAASQSCATLRDSVQAPAVQAVSGMVEVTDLVDGAFGPSATGLSTLGSVIGPASDGLGTTQGDLADGMRASWEWWRPDADSSAPLLGWLVFVAPLLLLLLAALGALCMGLSTHADSCASSVGVFLSGCAWVGYSLCSVLLLLACAFLVLVLAGLFDFGSVLKATADPNLLVGELRCAAPWNGEYRAAGQMAGATIFFDRDGDGASDGGGLNMCDIVTDCFREPSVSAQGAVEAAFGVKLSTGTWDAAVADALSRSGLDAVTTSDLDGASGSGRNASLAADSIDPATLCDGGCPAEVVNLTRTELASISAGVGRALTAIDGTGTLVQGALEAARTVVAQTPTVVGALAAVGASLECSWLKPAYRAPLEPLFGGSGVLGGLAGLAISMGVCGAAGILFLGWLITLQVYSGGVGKQPGCPRPCRCCCPSAKRDYPSRLSSEVEVIESTVVIV